MEREHLRKIQAQQALRKLFVERQRERFGNAAKVRRPASGHLHPGLQRSRSLLCVADEQLHDSCSRGEI